MTANLREPDDGDKLILSEFIPYRVVFLSRLISQQLSAAYADKGLSVPEWRVLAVVSQSDAMAARDVVALTPMDKMAVSRAVTSLEKKGLIQRSTASDRRVNELYLSETGREVFARAASSALAFEKELLEALTPEERREFHATLLRLEDRAREIMDGKQDG
jgi:DNA-binding MarR family transcriptional regulator